MLEREFYRRDSRRVAPDLLNKVLQRRGPGATVRSGRIVEVEAYCGSLDAGSHAYRGLTRRNATMFGPPGRLYVYFTYGMHHCVNATCGPEGEAWAVLIRALDPVEGLEAMAACRPGVHRRRDLASGPAKLSQALGLDRHFDGTDLVGAEEVCIYDDGMPAPAEPGNGVRIGLSAGAEHPWRWWVKGNENVSRPPPKLR
ncbi:MAG: DNA-3-methyladenine glycosylase [Acidimicrobiales bacterium]